MSKIAFFYKLGYDIVKEAAKGHRKRKKNEKPTLPLFKDIGKSKTTAIKDEILNIYKTIVGGKPDISAEELNKIKSLTGLKGGAKAFYELPYFKRIAARFGTASTPAKILSVTLPTLATGGIGYGVYKAKKEKSPLEKLQDILGL